MDPRFDTSLGARGKSLMSAVNRTALYYVCMPFGSHPGYRRLGLTFASFVSFSSDQFLDSGTRGVAVG